MENKICIVGKQNAGKTVMLKCLIALMWQRRDTSMWVIINNVYYPTPPATPFNSKRDIDYRIVFHYQVNKTTTKLVAISTRGDDDVEVMQNWDLFLGRTLGQIKNWPNGQTWTVPVLCISPCHPTDSSKSQERKEIRNYHQNIDFIHSIQITKISLRYGSPIISLNAVAGMNTFFKRKNNYPASQQLALDRASELHNAIDRYI